MKAIKNWFSELISDAKYSAKRIKNLEDFQDINLLPKPSEQNHEARLNPKDFAPVEIGLVKPASGIPAVNVPGDKNVPVIY